MNIVLPLRASHGISVAFWPHWQVPWFSLRHSADQRHLPSSTQGSIYLSPGTQQTPFPPTSAQGWLLLLSVPLGNPQQQSAEHRKHRALISSCCLLLCFLGSTSSSAAPPTLCGISVLLLWLCSILWGEAWGKGSSVGKKRGAAKCEDLPPVSAAQKCWSVFEELF